MTVKILYTDGACRNGAGGWAYLLDGEVVSGHVDMTTNNSMELMAIYQGLSALPAHTEVLVVTDSKLAIGWLRWHWKTNKLYIASLVEAIRTVIIGMDLKVIYFRVKGHSGHFQNEVVDRYARWETLDVER